jgi:transcriptional regulator with XRE-family HTH domain
MATQRTPSDEARAIGQRLRDARKARGLRAWDVAKRLEMTQQNYEFYEGGRNIIRTDRLREFADALGYHPHELWDILYPVNRSESERSKPTGRAERQVTMAGATPGYHNRSVTAPLSRC